MMGGEKMYKSELKTIIHNNKEKFENISDKIWENPETKYEEFKSSKIQINFLKENGFRIKEGIANIKTAFWAEYGKGFPVVGILGEFDALPNLSQVSDIAEEIPLEEGKPGHGCGHHLLGSASMEAVCSLKVLMEKRGIKGTIRYYGCPAEEGGAGKAFMVREGVFDDVDIAFTWHPGDMPVIMNKSLANTRIIFNFKGISAHAAAAPHLGRSALDAVELMNVGANYLREHIIPEARLHYAILNAGGDAPNVVQAEAKSFYAIRAPKITQLGEIVRRVSDIAKGAALMTETKVDIKVVSAYANLVANEALDKIMVENIKEFLPIEYTKEEIEYAKKFNALTSRPNPDNPMNTQLFVVPDNFIPPVSTDAGDVSWVVPTSILGAPTYAAGTQVHHWSAVAQGKSSIAHKGMHFAALIMASSALDVFNNTEIVEKAKKDLEKAKKGENYISLIPKETKPGDF